MKKMHIITLGLIALSIVAIPVVSAAQNVGIGTTTPTYPLTVKKDGIGISQENQSGTVQVGFFTGTGSAFVQTHSAHNLAFATGNGSARMIIQHTTGNVGINTATPTERLHIVGGLRLVNGSEGDGKVLTSDANGVAQWSNAPLGTNMRFRYKVEKSSPNAISTVYSTGTGITVAATSPPPGSGNGVRILRMQITFAEAGLYHLDANTTLITTIGDERGGLTMSIRDGSITTREYFSGRAGFFLGDFTNSSRWSVSKDASVDIYVAANQVVEIEAYGNLPPPFTNDFYQLIVGGYLISQ